MSNMVLDSIEQISWPVYRGQDATLLLTIIDTATGGSEVLNTSTFKCSFRPKIDESSSIAITLAMGSGISTSYLTGDVILTMTDTQSASLGVGTLWGQLWRDDAGEKQPVCLIELVVLERGTVI